MRVCASKDGANKEKAPCRLGRCREVSGSLDRGFEFLAAAEKYFSER